MSVIVDTSVWSLALRRSNPKRSEAVDRFRVEVTQGNVIMLGPIRQELLSGIRDNAVWEALKDKLRAFPDHPIETEDYETAGAYFNTCRSNGVQGTHTDLLICAVSTRCDFDILTTDNDFHSYSRLLPVCLI